MDFELEIVQHYLDPDSIWQMIEQGLRAEHFNGAEATEIYEWVLEYFSKSEFKLAPTKDVLDHEFRDYFAERGWPQEEHSLPYLTDKIKKAYQVRRFQDTILERAQVVIEEPEAAIQQTAGELMQILIDSGTANRNEIYSERFPDRINEYFERLDEKMRGDTVEGFYLGWDEIQEHTGGLLPGEFGAIAAFTGVGKSWALNKIALEAAARGTKVYLASLENSKEMTLMRIDCLAAGIPWRRYERAELTMPQVEQLKRAKGFVREEVMDNLILDCPRSRNERSIFELYTRARFHGSEMLVGDQLSWVKPRDDYRGNRTAQMGEIVNEIADLTREYGLASMWAVQFNRESQNKKGRGGLSNIALSSEIEQIVDLGVGMSARPEMKENQMALFEILKGRRFENKAWLMDWHLAERTYLGVRREYMDGDDL